MDNPLIEAERAYATAKSLTEEIAGECRRLMNHCVQLRGCKQDLARASGDILKRRARATLEVHVCDMIQWRASLQRKITSLVKFIDDAGAHVDVSEILEHCPEEVVS
jgi:hypothetical protein